MEPVELAINETFKHKGFVFKTVEHEHLGNCKGCSLRSYHEKCEEMLCISKERSDCKNVRFERVKTGAKYAF